MLRLRPHQKSNYKNSTNRIKYGIGHRSSFTGTVHVGNLRNSLALEKDSGTLLAIRASVWAFFGLKIERSRAKYVTFNLRSRVAKNPRIINGVERLMREKLTKMDRFKESKSRSTSPGTDSVRDIIFFPLQVLNRTVGDG